ncbi:ABC transporter substrate-binding protein [Siccirubricoccus sp. G192]|uniref:ABC transporter substrate-binding protein n=1 Tax=Siccirubricoccus sp. G192 TaxID=2849651 RepID=UPI001C2C41E6|nr:ABC transporter substrate-binding protein [Siccirubricoccus sp. G192]MBV1798531.1 ABC transporter substrate-binding protein [Siccirubricoccus sp. G192]
MIRKTVFAALLAACAIGASAQAQHLRLALREDPDILDPTLSRTYVGRIVYAAICDKLFDINEKLEIVPQLATAHRWEDPKTLLITLRDGVRFHDGEVMDAEAVRYSLNRHLTLPGSFRRSEMGDVQAVEVVDPRTVRIRLKGPSGAFLAALTDRAGMILSPKAAEAAGRNFGTHPVCAGPFRFVERVAQERIVVERFPDYWDAGRVHLNRVTYLPIPDNTVRLANLQSGAVEFAERMEPDDMQAIQGNRNLRVVAVDELGYQGITININNGPRADTPFGRDARVRAAFELAIDRAAINQVVYEGKYTPTRQPIPPASPYHARDFQPEPRDVARARALLREAGVTTPLTVEMTVPNNPDLRQVGEVIQAMVQEAGFDLRLRATESPPPSRRRPGGNSRPSWSAGPAAPTRTAISTASPAPAARRMTAAIPIPRWTACSTPRGRKPISRSAATSMSRRCALPSARTTRGSISGTGRTSWGMWRGSAATGRCRTG